METRLEMEELMVTADLPDTEINDSIHSMAGS